MKKKNLIFLFLYSLSFSAPRSNQSENNLFAKKGETPKNILRNRIAMKARGEYQQRKKLVGNALGIELTCSNFLSRAKEKISQLTSHDFDSNPRLVDIENVIKIMEMYNPIKSNPRVIQVEPMRTVHPSRLRSIIEEVGQTQLTSISDAFRLNGINVSESDSNSRSQMPIDPVLLTPELVRVSDLYASDRESEEIRSHVSETPESQMPPTIHRTQRFRTPSSRNSNGNSRLVRRFAEQQLRRRENRN